ncbi:MAG: hypothetical protein QW587_04805 [Candidatus Bathyarchaeia archaeon]
MRAVTVPKSIRLRGFFLSVHSPSDEHLQVQYDATGLAWGQYRRLVEGLQDLLREVDESYKEGLRLRGRGLKARYKRGRSIPMPEGGKPIVERRRLLKFSPYPSRFTNILSNLRAELYAEINASCIVLQRFVSGYYRESIYLAPESELPRLIELKDSLNKRIAELRRSCEEFKASDEAKQVRRLLEQYGFRGDPYEGLGEVPEVRMSFSQASIHPGVLDAVVDERVRLELQRQQTELFGETVKKLRETFDAAIGNIAKSRSLNSMRQAVNRLDRLRAMAESVGLAALAESVKPLCDKPERLVESEAVKKRMLETVSSEIGARAAALLAELGGEALPA